MAQIEILCEQEIAAGWTFKAQLIDEEGSLIAIELTLSWADYNLWSPNGADEPQLVAEAVLGYLASQSPEKGLPPSLDASLVRRMFPDADQQIPKLIRNSH